MPPVNGRQGNNRKLPYGLEFQSVVTAVTNRSSFMVGGLVLPGNPFDGHTLKTALDQVRMLCDQRIEEVYVDRGYRGHDETDSAVYISGQKRVVTARIRRCLKRRQAIKPAIGHLKQDG